MSGQAQLLPGTLDLLILKAVSLGPLHGYGVLLRIGQISGQALLIEQGAFIPLYSGWCVRVFWTQAGARPKTSAAPNSTYSRRRDTSGCDRKRTGGTALPQRWVPF